MQPEHFLIERWALGLAPSLSQCGDLAEPYATGEREEDLQPDLRRVAQGSFTTLPSRDLSRAAF
jgi:hypothetical protein